MQTHLVIASVDTALRWRLLQSLGRTRPLLATNKPVKLTISAIKSSSRDGNLAFTIKVGTNTVGKVTL